MLTPTPRPFSRILATWRVRRRLHLTARLQKDNFYAIVESMHVADDAGSVENVSGQAATSTRSLQGAGPGRGASGPTRGDPTGHSGHARAQRGGKEQIGGKSNGSLQDITPSTDPTRVASTRADRGPLQAGWAESGEYPLMCCYKVCQVKFKWFGLQTRAERAIQANYPRLFTKFHRGEHTNGDWWIAALLQKSSAGWTRGST